MPGECRFCEQAKLDPTSGLHSASCAGCTIRRAAVAPKDRREQMIDDVRERDGQAAADAFTAAVLDEFNRRQAARRAGRKQGESR